jgi:hypothetical protein
MREALVARFGKAFGSGKAEYLKAALVGNLTGAVGRDGIDDDPLVEERVGTSEAVGQDALLVLDDQAKRDIVAASEFLNLSQAQVGMLAGIEEDAVGSQTGQMGGIAALQIGLPFLAKEDGVALQQCQNRDR